MKRILLVDDEKVLNESLTDVIEALGHQVNSYLSIKEARQQVDFSALDLVICDVGLPGENAFAFVSWVKQNFDIPFILLSAFNEEDMMKKGIDAGADHYLVKPAQLHELRKVLDTHK